MSAFKDDDSPKSMREIIQKKVLDDIIGRASASSESGWMVLVVDERATRVISAALTMFDIMEKRITLVESLAKSRQPFKEMDVIYIIDSKSASVRKVVADFESENTAKYANVHLYFLDKMAPDLFQILQYSPILINKIRTLNEVYLNIIAAESCVFHLDLPDTLPLLYGMTPEVSYNQKIAQELATFCVTLNEYPTIRYQASSRNAQEIASTLNRLLLEMKRSTSTSSYWCHGEEGHMERERGQIIILDRSFDPLSPIMHEYSYQAMINDLLQINENVMNYLVETNSGTKVEKTLVLQESDELWVEFRHLHIARVILLIKERMNDIIQNSGAASLTKQSGSNMSITAMAAAVRDLPEYRETMTKLSQHVYLAQQCMDAFNSQGLMEISQLEQTISTGFDDDGKEVKTPQMVRLLSDKLRSNTVTKMQKIRLIAIFMVSQKVVSREDRMLLMTDAQLTGPEQQILRNFERINATSGPVATNNNKSKFFGLFKGKSAAKPAATPEGEYAETRHVCELKVLLDQLISGELPLERYPSLGLTTSTTNEHKSIAKSARRAPAATTRQGLKKDHAPLSGGRYMAFVVGGLGYSEMKCAYDLMSVNSKEVIVGGSHLISPNKFIRDVALLDPDSSRAIEALA